LAILIFSRLFSFVSSGQWASNESKRTTNAQHPMSGARLHWMFDVGCWLFDVSTVLNFHHRLVFRPDDLGFRFHRAQRFRACEAFLSLENLFEDGSQSFFDPNQFGGWKHTQLSRHARFFNGRQFFDANS